MTCIVACAKEGKIWMGADNAMILHGSTGHLHSTVIFPNGDSKMRKLVNGLLVGVAGDTRPGNLIKLLAKHLLENQHESEPTEEYMRITVPNAIQNLLITNGAKAWGSVSGTDACAAQCIFGYKGRIYFMSEAFGVNLIPTQGQENDSFWAVGNGSHFALAALEAMKDQRLSPLEKILKALSISAKYSPCVRGPFDFITTDDA